MPTRTRPDSGMFFFSKFEKQNNFEIQITVCALLSTKSEIISFTKRFTVLLRSSLLTTSYLILRYE